MVISIKNDIVKKSRHCYMNFRDIVVDRTTVTSQVTKVLAFIFVITRTIYYLLTIVTFMVGHRSCSLFLYSYWSVSVV